MSTTTTMIQHAWDNFAFIDDLDDNQKEENQRQEAYMMARKHKELLLLNNQQEKKCGEQPHKNRRKTL